MKQFLFFLALMFLFSMPVFAAHAAEQCDANSNELCNPIGTTEFTVLLEKVGDFLIKVGIYGIAPLMVVVGGFQIMTAGGKSEQVSTGLRTIKWALIGVVLLFLARGLAGLIQDILGVM